MFKRRPSGIFKRRAERQPNLLHMLATYHYDDRYTKLCQYSRMFSPARCCVQSKTVSPARIGYHGTTHSHLSTRRNDTQSHRQPHPRFGHPGAAMLSMLRRTSPFLSFREVQKIRCQACVPSQLEIFQSSPDVTCHI